GNLYAEYCASPKAKRNDVLQRFVRTWFDRRKDMPDEFEDASHDLLPVLRPRSYYELTKIQMKLERESDLGWPYEIIADSLGLSITYDLPDSMRMITQDSLNEWKVEFEAAMQVALKNLESMSKDGLTKIGRGVWQSPWHDNYDAARI